MKINKPLFFVMFLLLTGSLGCAAASHILFGAPDAPPTSAPFQQAPLVSNPTSQACEGEDCAEACMSLLSPYLGQAGNPLSPARGSLNARGTSENEIVLVTYEIDGNNLVAPVLEDVPQDLRALRDDTTAHQSIWNYYTAIIPPGERTMLDSLVLFTDGLDNTLAWVDTSPFDETKWSLGVDLRDTHDPRELTYTLIHEYAHLVTLSEDQMPYSSQACNTYASDGYCATSSSYINQFVEQFWLEHLVEWSDINAITDEDEYYQQLEAFYNTYQDEFITEYAATSPEEDLAETWSFFILSPKPHGATIAEQKILFLYQFDELVRLRTQIVNGLCAYAGQ